MLPAEAVGSPEYFAKILEDCHKGCQRCFECHVLDCHDNMHPARVAGLECAILDFHELEYQLRAKVKRLNELNESSMAVTRRCQADVREHRDRLKRLREAIRVNQEDADERGEYWGMLDAFDKQGLQKLEHYISGLQAALTIMDTDGRVDERRDGSEEGC